VATYAHTLALTNRADDEIVILAAYFHDISSASLGPQDHNLRSAELALEWLSQRGYSKTRAKRVAAAIVAHMRPEIGSERDSLPIESRILYDADKVSRARGLGLAGALVHLGQRTPWEQLSYAELAAAIRHGRERTHTAYCTLHTKTAQLLAGPGHRQTLEFCDQVLALEVFRERPA
jgi:HD superfamily phosphodiesterase